MLANFNKFLLEYVYAIFALFWMLLAVIETETNKLIIKSLTVIIFMFLYIRDSIKIHTDKKLNSDSPTPQNWVYFEVLVRGKEYDYQDFIVLMDLDNHIQHIKDYYKNEGLEVLDIQVRYISKRI